MPTSLKRPRPLGIFIILLAGFAPGCDNTEVIPLEKERPIVIVSPPGSQAASTPRLNPTSSEGKNLPSRPRLLGFTRSAVGL
jgi:hypothetical protein